MVSSWLDKSLSADGKTITLVSNTNFNDEIISITCMQKSSYPIEPDTPSDEEIIKKLWRKGKNGRRILRK